MQTQLWCLYFTGSYVLSLYCIPHNIRTLPRDNNLHIRYRIGACTISTVISLLLYCFLANTNSVYTSALESLGLQSISRAVKSIAITMSLMLLFYLGPVVVFIANLRISTSSNISWNGILVKKGKRASISQLLKTQLVSNISSSTMTLHFRNLVFAPVSEEIVFRGLLVAVMACDIANGKGGGVGYICTTVPAWFALAHVHHLLEKILVQNQPVATALVSTLVQITYTSIFGAIATFLHLRTGSLAAPITSHIVCNFMGLPDMGFLIPSGQQNSTSLSYLYQYRHLIIVAHGLGLVAFICAITPFTSSLADSSVFWKIIEVKNVTD